MIVWCLIAVEYKGSIVVNNFPKILGIYKNKSKANYEKLRLSYKYSNIWIQETLYEN